MRLKVFTIVLTGTVALLGTGCASTRSVSTNSSTELTTGYTNVTNVRDSVFVEVHDTVTVTKTVTVVLREPQEPQAPPDTVRVSTVTDRERVRDRSAVRAQEKKVEVRVDTVYVAVRDSTSVSTVASDPSTSSGRAPAWLSALKWIFWIIVSLTVLIVVFKLTRRF